VAEEVPVALEYNGVSHAVMLATPADLEDFALGFSLSEGIVDVRPRSTGMEVCPRAGLTVQAAHCRRRFAVLKDRRRSWPGAPAAACVASKAWPQAVQPVQPWPRPCAFDASAVLRRCRPCAAARRCASHRRHPCRGLGRKPMGTLVLVREDVGRHNALDKLVGALLHAGWLAGPEGFVVITSRASYEMVGKTARAGVALLAAVSGVTGLAIDVAQQAGVALAGFARGTRPDAVYAHRIHWERLKTWPGGQYRWTPTT
jgi:FdhD protein